MVKLQLGSGWGSAQTSGLDFDFVIMVTSKPLCFGHMNPVQLAHGTRTAVSGTVCPDQSLTLFIMSYFHIVYSIFILMITWVVQLEIWGDFIIFEGRGTKSDREGDWWYTELTMLTVSLDNDGLHQLADETTLRRNLKAEGLKVLLYCSNIK